MKKIKINNNRYRYQIINMTYIRGVRVYVDDQNIFGQLPKSLIAHEPGVQYIVCVTQKNCFQNCKGLQCKMVKLVVRHVLHGSPGLRRQHNINVPAFTIIWQKLEGPHNIGVESTNTNTLIQEKKLPHIHINRYL